MKSLALIIGSTNFNDDNQSEFESMAAILKVNGIGSLIPHKLFEGIDDETLKQTDVLRAIAAAMIDSCTMVVTLKDWDLYDLNKSIVLIARTCKLEVVPFTKYVSENAQA